MGKTIRKQREMRKPRNMEVLGMILNCKGGPMRDRRERRIHEKENYLEEYEESTGEELELDVIALCCDFTEYKNFKELQREYPEIKDMEDLQDHTTVLETNGDNFIIQNF